MAIPGFLIVYSGSVVSHRLEVSLSLTPPECRVFDPLNTLHGGWGIRFVSAGCTGWPYPFLYEDMRKCSGLNLNWIRSICLATDPTSHKIIFDALARRGGRPNPAKIGAVRLRAGIICRVIFIWVCKHYNEYALVCTLRNLSHGTGREPCSRLYLVITTWKVHKPTPCSLCSRSTAWKVKKNR